LLTHFQRWFKKRSQPWGAPSDLRANIDEASA